VFVVVFFSLALVLMLVGRRLGWALSKPLYSAPLFLVVLVSLIWGAIVAGAIRELVVWQQPSTLLRWVMGYALGGYVAILNYGLLDESSVPDEVLSRHVALKAVPTVTYVASSLALAWIRLG
jgi:hypothetical protein